MRKIHLYKAVNVRGDTHSSCGIKLGNLHILTHTMTFHETFAVDIKHVTCKNCKRTELFRKYVRGAGL